MITTICPECSHKFIVKAQVKERVCEGCGKGFTGDERYSFCTTKCRNKAARRRYRARNGEKIRQRVKQAYQRKMKDPAFAEKMRLNASLYWQKSKAENPEYRIKNYLRGRIRKLIKRRGMARDGLLGCSGKELVRKFEGMFTGQMRWDNYGSVWVVDHVHPLASFDLSKEAQLRQACHWTNLRPLLKEENEEKGSRVTVPQLPLMLPA